MDELTHDATSRTLDTPKGTLHYHEAGDGPPLLLLHGSGPGVSGWANFRGNLPAFAEHYRTLVLDMPGFGKSYSSERQPGDGRAGRGRSTSSTVWGSVRSRSSATRWAATSPPASRPTTPTG